jgi:hypothetical protein
MKKLNISLVLAFVLLLIPFAALELFVVQLRHTYAAGPHYVANDCTGVPVPCYLTIQAAIDAATTSDVIKVAAGTYSDINNYGGEAQIAYLSKTVTIVGGYTDSFTEPPNPAINRTILDAKGLGRGIYITGEVSPTVEGLWITDGKAFNGGGIYIITATAYLINNWVYSNTADYFGGGIYSIGGSTIERSTITTNTADSGGGGVLLIGGGGAAQDMGIAKFNFNTVSHNTACYAGGIDLVWSTAVLTANLIHGNIAKYCGDDGSGIGGGVLIDQESDATLINNMIADNQVDTSGGGLYISGSSPKFLHNTIVRNSGGNGSGIHIEDRFGVFSISSFTNTILTSHTNAITVATNNTVTLESTLWSGNITNWDGSGTIITGTNNYTGSPAFVNPDAGNYHLTFASAAINKGIDSGVTFDIDGQTRDSRPDLGADEIQLVYLPVLLKN